VRLPALVVRQRVEPAFVAACERGQRNAFAIEQAVAGERGEAGARRQDAGQVERISARQRDERAGIGAASYLAQRADRVGQRKLFAREAGDETAAADLAARFESAIAAQQVAPRRQPGRFAFEYAPEDDAVAAQQRPRDMFDRVWPGVRWRRRFAP